MGLLALAQSRAAFSVFSELDTLFDFQRHIPYLTFPHHRYCLISAGEEWESPTFMAKLV
jgi:hypothetical protein